MNSQDMFNGMINNQKRAERIGNSYDYDANDNDDWDDDDWSDDDDFSGNTVIYKYIITNSTSVSALANQIAANMSKSQNKPRDSVYQQAYQQAEKWIKEHHERGASKTIIRSETHISSKPLMGSSVSLPAIFAERRIREQATRMRECDKQMKQEYLQTVGQQVQAQQPSVSVKVALAALKQVLTDNTLKADTIIKSEDNSIMIVGNQYRFCMTTDAITKQTLTKIADKMNRRFHSDNNMNIELMLIDLKTALEMADWNRYTLHMQKQ